MPKVLWVIPCPLCGKKLRVHDQALLGRRGQCPTCRHKFILEVPRAPEFLPKGESDLNIATAAPEETVKLGSDFHLPPDEAGMKD